MGLRSSEWVALGYFAVLALIALSRSRRRAVVGAILAAAAVVASAWVPDALWRIWALDLGWIRDWAPPLFVLVGYWLPAQLVVGVDYRFERWLLESDHRWIGGLLRRAARAPRPCIELAEAAYLCCYPMIPGGFVILLVGGHAAEADRYWTALLWAAALSYGSLAFVASRPPRELEPVLVGALPRTPARSLAGARCPAPLPRGRAVRAAVVRPSQREQSSHSPSHNGLAVDSTQSTIRRLNLLVLGRASVQLNTCPSGHVATSVAAALAVWSAWPAAGIALGVLAGLITIASVTSRYHYAFDAVTGIAVGLSAFVLAR